MTKRYLHVGVAQWLAVPGEPEQNLQSALAFVHHAAEAGVELLLLPELWPCGYDPVTLERDVRAAAEPLDGPRCARLAQVSQSHRIWLAAGSIPERAEDGRLYNTAVVFDPRGSLVATHRKAHLYPPTRESSVFEPGDSLTTFDAQGLGTIGLLVCFDGDFPEVARTLAARGARMVLAPAAYEVEGATAWDVLYPAAALANGQWWIQANQCGTNRSCTLLGGSRILAPTGTVTAEARRAHPGGHAPPELIAHRIDMDVVNQEGLSALLDHTRRPELYVDTGPRGR